MGNLFMGNGVYELCLEGFVEFRSSLANLYSVHAVVAREAAFAVTAEYVNCL
jgi:hypothetical protein